MVQQGVSFSNNLVSVSLCCPSRATGLRGQYSHNTGIKTNGGTTGGFATMFANGLESSTIATWLNTAGYRTALFGKYLNGYPNTAGDTYVPPGWDEWYSSVKGSPYSQYNYTLNENGTLVSYGNKKKDYGNTVYTKKTKDFVTRAAQAGEPFFAYLSVYAPHGPATPAPGDEVLFPGATAPRTPNFNEADVSDKPAWVQAKPLLNAEPAEQARRDLPQAAPVAAGGGPLDQPADQHAEEERPAGQHLHRVHLRQRLPPRPAPPAAGQADRVRGRRPRAAHRPRSRRAGEREAGPHRRQHRPRADVRGTGWRGDAGLRRRALHRVACSARARRP